MQADEIKGDEKADKVDVCKNVNFQLNPNSQKTLAENVRNFETMKEAEKKKLEEERKWVRREKSMFEKSLKDKKNNFERRTLEEVEELQNKVRNVSFAQKLLSAYD